MGLISKLRGKSVPLFALAGVSELMSWDVARKIATGRLDEADIGRAGRGLPAEMQRFAVGKTDDAVQHKAA